MRIVVAYKWAADYQEATVDCHGDVDWSRARPVVSSYDAVAMELARRIADATSAEVVGLSVGGDDVASPIATKTALARGLDRTVVVTDKTLQEAGTTQIAETLARAIKHIGDVNLVLAGDSSIDVAAKMVSSVLAGWLGWLGFADISGVTMEPDHRLRLIRSVVGHLETLMVVGPAVVAVASDAVVPPTPGMKDILAAGKKPVERLGLADIGGLESITGTVQQRARPVYAPHGRHHIDTSDTAKAAAELVRILQDTDIL